MPNNRGWDTADSGNVLAHEIGHYRGLFHTHPGWGTGEIYQGNADTAAEAEQRVLEYAAANGGTIEAFDGDLLADTTPDCCRDLYAAEPEPRQLGPGLGDRQRHGGRHGLQPRLHRHATTS